MKELTSEQVRAEVESCGLFQEFFQLPGAAAFRAELSRVRGWSLESGECLRPGSAEPAAYALLSSGPSAGTSSGTIQSPGEVAPARIVGQWSALSGGGATEVQSEEPARVLELRLPLVARLLEPRSSAFKLAFYLPLAAGHRSLAGIPPELLAEVVRGAQFRFPCFHANQVVVSKGEHGDTMFFVLEGSVRVEDEGQTLGRMSRGDFFGEIAILTAGVRGATVTAENPALLMECGRAQVGKLRKKSKPFAALLVGSLRKFGISDVLRRSPLFQDMQAEHLEMIGKAATLETFDPYQPLFFQDDPADALYLVLDGTVALVQETEAGPQPVPWLRAGDVLGEIALLSEVTSTRNRTLTATALQRVDALRIPEAVFRELVTSYPLVRQDLERRARQRLERDASRRESPRDPRELRWLLDTQHVAAEAALAVDMDACIQCGNCVAACKSVHEDGLNRFFWDHMRQGEGTLPRLQFSHSCQHCEFPLCIEPCPTQCISREPGGAVYIDYDNCIRCGQCADPSKGCPYGSIELVPAESVTSTPYVPLLTRLTGWMRSSAAPADAGKPETRKGGSYPSKCDLCHGLSYQACVEHCPTGAVLRLNGIQDLSPRVMNPAAGGVTPRASEPPIAVFPTLTFAKDAVLNRPTELHLTLSRQGNGPPLLFRKPEPGVTRLVLNFFLVAPDNVTVGRGGALQQLVISADSLEGEMVYALTPKSPGPHELKLAIYQGGFYLGQRTTHLAIKGN